MIHEDFPYWYIPIPPQRTFPSSHWTPIRQAKSCADCGRRNFAGFGPKDGWTIFVRGLQVLPRCRPCTLKRFLP